MVCSTNYKISAEGTGQLRFVRWEADGTIDKYAKKEALKIRQEADS